jgi:hypothetical protein
MFGKKEGRAEQRQREGILFLSKSEATWEVSAEEWV